MSSNQSKKQTNRHQKSCAEPRVGDFLVIPDGDSWILSEVIQMTPTVVAYGDVYKTLPPMTGAIAFRDCFKPDILRFVGNGRMSLEDWRNTLRPLMTVTLSEYDARFVPYRNYPSPA